MPIATESHRNPLGLSDPSLFIQTSLINGEWTKYTSAETFDVVDPATDKVIGRCQDMDVSDTRQAIEQAHEAFATYSKTSPQFRADILARYHLLLLQNAEDIARLVVFENGKSLLDARAEVAYAASYLQWYSGEALRCYGQTIPCSIPGVRNMTIKQPIGPCALLLPWNYPLAMLVRKSAPVLAVGATCVIKGPSETPFSINALVELGRRAGVPPNVVNVITTERNLVSIGKELCENKKIKKISFTGSTRVGKILMAQCAGSLKKMSMELGGNAPFIVFDDADIPSAVAGAIASKFRNSGQTCVCAQRLYVQESVYEEFATQLVQAVAKFKVGNGFEPGVTHGPLIHSRAADKVEEHVNDAVAAGAKVLIGGERLGPCFYPPTVLRDVPRDCLLTSEETFGPLAALIKFSTEEEVISMANDIDVGLSGYFFSENSDRIWRVAEALQVGMVGANTGVISQSVIPFGGVKESGWGKEGGAEGTAEYCLNKLICIGTTGSK